MMYPIWENERHTPRPIITLISKHPVFFACTLLGPLSRPRYPHCWPYPCCAVLLCFVSVAILAQGTHLVTCLLGFQLLVCRLFVVSYPRLVYTYTLTYIYMSVWFMIRSNLMLSPERRSFKFVLWLDGVGEALMCCHMLGIVWPWVVVGSWSQLFSGR